MKADELRPCDRCQGPLVPVFWVLRVSPAVFDQRAVDQLVGTAQIFGGGAQALQVARSFVPDHLAKIAGDEPGGEWSEVLLCNDCVTAPASPAYLVELADAAKERFRKAVAG